MDRQIPAVHQNLGAAYTLAVFRTLSRLFRLRPYGDHLIDGMAELWLALAGLNIASIAICDAIAWAYFGYTTAPGLAGWITAGLAGLIVLTLVGSLDAMFVMQDRSEAKNIRQERLAIAARVVLVILTFTVTAPFLTQLFFARDIEANIRGRNEQKIAARRAGLAADFESRKQELHTQVVGRQRDLENEIAGNGTSRRYGNGPTATAIQRHVSDLQSEIAAADRAKAQELQSFDAAIATPEVLANRYGVDLVREGPDTRAAVIAELEKSASFRATSRTIKAFLLFMFLGLVCLKLFQPESVRIYYSARLQAGYARAQTGIFNHRLDPREHPEAGGMNPIRFADWYQNDQEVREVTDRLREQTALTVERLKVQEEAVRVLEQTLRSDMIRMHDELANASGTGDQLEQQAQALRQELELLTSRIAEDQQQLDDFRYDLGADLSLADQQLLISSRGQTVRRLAERKAAASGVTASINRVMQRLQAHRSYEEQIRESIAAAGGEVAALTGSLQEARRRRAADILGA